MKQYLPDPEQLATAMGIIRYNLFWCHRRPRDPASDLCYDKNIPCLLGSWAHMASINVMRSPVHDALAAEITINRGPK